MAVFILYHLNVGEHFLRWKFALRRENSPPLPESIRLVLVRGFNFIYSIAFVAWRHAKMSSQGTTKTGMS
jgi:hypothetical protein